jgi:adenine-specific DNA-methyltransferase
MEKQIEEWYFLDILSQKITPQDLLRKININSAKEKFSTNNAQFLSIDTRFFPNIESFIISSFINLEENIDGWLIHSENYQALLTLTKKFKGKIDAIYIDPPYNADSTEISYENTYKHSSWLSLIENRASQSKPLLAKNSVFVCAIDEVEQESLGNLFSTIFWDRQKTCVVVIHNATGQQGNNFSSTHEYAYFLYPLNGNYIGLENREDNPDIRPLRNVSKGAHLRTDAANCFYPILIKEKEIIGFGNVCDDDFHPEGKNVLRTDGVIEVYPIDNNGIERKWVFARQSVESIIDELTPKFDDTKNEWDITACCTDFNYGVIF